MKTKKIAVLVVVVMLVGVFALSACGSNEKDFVGTWTLKSMVQADVDLAVEDFGITGEIVISDDGKFTLDIMGSTQSGTWKAKNATTVTLTLSGDDQDASVADGKLTLEQDATKLIFEKAK
ncbi:MAG: hypothetical protein LBU41_03920 [Clostridiales Family XIII bacterium]|jgi:hypothetical protein|nr:hypothetical protein [Clostridiales Family XIII bacterium]